MNAPLLALAEARPVTKPTVFLPGFPSRDPEPIGDLAVIAERLRIMADGAEIGLRMGRSAYPGFEPFASITASAAGGYLCTIGGPWPTEADHARACLDLTRALR